MRLKSGQKVADRCRCGGKFNLYDGLLVCPKCGQIKQPEKKKGIFRQRKVVNNYARSTITLSSIEKAEWLKIKERGRYSWNGLLHLVRLDYLKIKALEQELQDANRTLRQLALKNADMVRGGKYNTSAPITRLRPPPPPDLSDPEIMKAQNLKAQAMRDLKQKFIETEDVMSLLTPVPPEELTDIPSRQVHKAIIEGTYIPN